MKKRVKVLGVLIVLAFVAFAFSDKNETNLYQALYVKKFHAFLLLQQDLQKQIEITILDSAGIEKLEKSLVGLRVGMKKVDFWMRYLNPLLYKKINAPLPVEWETEVFEKFEKPYRHEGGGYTLLAMYLGEGNCSKDSLLKLVEISKIASGAFLADTISGNLQTPGSFFFCNRLFLLNLAGIYTTGFECPLPEQIIPELLQMLYSVEEINQAYNQTFPTQALSDEYQKLFSGMLRFVELQPKNHEKFDHFGFLKAYVDPLFSMNQEMIRKFSISSKSNVDYALSKSATSIFDKRLYVAQNTKGIYSGISDPAVIRTVENLGRQLFFDPLLSGNDQRSCASCHKPDMFFADTLEATNLNFDRSKALLRNTPTLLNAEFNHLIMFDGKHLSLQDQAKGVITNPDEMACDEKLLLKKILDCKDYNKQFCFLLKYTPQEKQVTIRHISSALTAYYSKFSTNHSAFDEAMKSESTVDKDMQEGFNLFMGKAQCATCHFVPQFNGVKPPYVSSEFEVVGVPEKSDFNDLSDDNGRHDVNPAKETFRAFRTPTLRNSARTAPYMHNGVFKNLDEVLEFYDAGGGQGHGLAIENQTLSGDSLHLTDDDKRCLTVFIHALTEKVPVEKVPETLPLSRNKELNKRKPGGVY